jgi:hypothetical protein
MNGTVLAFDRPETTDREEFRHSVLAGLSGSPRAIPASFCTTPRLGAVRRF